MKTGVSDRVREFARRQYIEPARKRGQLSVRIVAGEVHKALHLQNRSPQVCSALRSKKFLEQNRIVLDNAEGPQGGMSTTVKFTYRLLAGKPETKTSDPLLALSGIAKGVFKPGELEALIRHDREHFYGSGKEP